MTSAAKPSKSTVKVRNPLALDPLMRKSHAHTKSNKTERAKRKQELQNELQKQLKEG